MMRRKSNVILIDKFDKVNSIFYNAFYERKRSKKK